jgi:hypothetical protein
LAAPILIKYPTHSLRSSKVYILISYDNVTSQNYSKSYSSFSHVNTLIAIIMISVVAVILHIVFWMEVTVAIWVRLIGNDAVLARGKRRGPRGGSAGAGGRVEEGAGVCGISLLVKE